MARKKSAAKKAREAAARAAENGNVAQDKGNAVNDKGSAAKDAGSAKVAAATTAAPAAAVSDSESDSESSSSEEEDDFGDLVTEEVEQGISTVLNAIRNNDTAKLLDPEAKFFADPETAAAAVPAKKTDKPIYLKDYHRMNLLSGHVGSDDEDEGESGEGKDHKTIDGKPSFVAQQRDERNKLLSEINDAFDGDDNGDDNDNSDDDDGFLKKKEPKAEDKDAKVTGTALPDPQNEDAFLDEFMGQQAWMPKEGDRVIDLDMQDEDDEEFDAAAEQFENAYNFRFEDANSAEIVSYARNQATLRRSATNSRRRKREDEKREKEEEHAKKEQAVQKKKTKKANKLTDVLEQLKKEFGAEIDEKMVKKISSTLLNSDYSEDNWDSVVAELFNDEFYNAEEKPEWDDDLMHEDVYEGEGEHNEAEQDEAEETEESEAKVTKKTKKEGKLKEKKEKKRLSEMVDKAIEQNKLSIIDEVEQEEQETRGRSQNVEDGVKFRYREVSPESFGLTHREIFAADDADLNDFISLKKFAPYRAKELIAKDKRKVTKSRRLRDWRKKVFNKEDGLQLNADGEPNEDIEVNTDSHVAHDKKRKRDDKHHHHSKKSKKHKSHKK